MSTPLLPSIRPRAWPRLAAVLLACASLAMPALAARIKEVAAVEGVRTNQLTGFGLVVGLDGTGDQTTQMPYTSQGLSNYLQQMGITLPAASCLAAAAQERGRGAGHGPAAGLRPAGPGDRRQRVLAGQLPSRSRAAC